MPIRFTSPSLGGHYESHLRAAEWKVGVFYRRLTANQWFVNDEIREDLAPFGGQSPRFINIQSVDLAVTYALSDRFSLRLTLPFSTGSLSKIHPDSSRHATSATGLGDLNLVGNFWLFQPSRHVNGNVALGAGVKARPEVIAWRTTSLHRTVRSSSPSTNQSSWVVGAGE
jgi:hypothetical protein